MLIREFDKQQLNIKIFDNRENMGRVAADNVIKITKLLLRQKFAVNIIFPAAPSQNELLYNLSCSDIDFSRINAFHMDEYIGLDKSAPQGFGNFLARHLFDKCGFNNVFYLDGNAKDLDAECERYSHLLEKYPVDISLVGVGENGHIAFNDPHVADFNDSKLVKRVKLDEKCRQQQVNDGAFEKIDDVPIDALTLTIPALLDAKYIFCTVPTKNKAWAVEKTINGHVSEECPASILRTKKDAIMFLDADSGKDFI